jgi:arabinofuranosyltransferase
MNSLVHKYRLLVILPLGVYVYLLVQTAWCSDDAYITFRSIENFFHGYGPVFNVGERVQTFTHPLWFLLQTLANYVLDLWKENPLHNAQIYFLNIFMSMGLSLAAMLILGFGIASSTRDAVLGIAILSGSKAFIDYSTSGLENPLTHAILVLFLWMVFSNRRNSPAHIFTLTLLAGLGGLNRLDALLLFLPTLVLLFLQNPDKQKTAGGILLGLSPLIAWEIFSILYYGTPFPNTAYAKINAEIPLADMLRQGLWYFRNSLYLDPITLLVITAVILLGWKAADLHRKAVLTGVLLYLAYILYIGGDFMSGRYFSTPLLGAAAVLVSTEFKSAKSYALSLAAALILGLAPVYLIPERQASFGSETGNWRVFRDEHGITDERHIYTRYGLGLMQTLSSGTARTSDYSRENWIYEDIRPVHVELVGPLGMSAYGYGPNVHVIDVNALADPLMARLPLIDPSQWRIGHFRHMIPEGYVETLESGENRITDPKIAEYYDNLTLVTRGGLWSRARLVAIWKLNTGRYDHLLEDASAYVDEG